MKHFNNTILLIIFVNMVGIKASAYNFASRNDDGIIIYYNYNNDRTVRVTYQKEGSPTSSYSGNVVIPEFVGSLKVTSIGDKAFYGCSSLSSVIIGNSVTTIGESAFSGCSSLSSVSFGNSVTTIGESAFSRCSSLSSIILPNTVTNISSYAFWGTSWYDSQPDGLVYTGKIAYRYKGEMPENTKIVIKNGTTVIANSAFSSCKGLVSIDIPNSVKNIGNDAFYECNNLQSVYIDDLDSWCNIIMGEDVFIYRYEYKSYDGKNLIDYRNYKFHLFVKGEELQDLIVPNTVDTIRKGNFSNCLLGSATIPNHVKKIEEGAFTGCNLISLKINMPLQSRMDKIFGQNLQSIEIGNDVGSIPSSFYYSAYSGRLQSITIGANVVYIGENAFSKPEHYEDTPAKVIFLPNISEVYKDRVYGRTWYTSDDYPLLSSMFEVDGIKYVPISLSERTCEAIDCNYSSSVKDVHIGDNVTYKGVSMRVVKINPYLFKGHNYIENLTIDLKKEIPHDAFNECINLKTAFISDNVTGIGSNAFYNCKKLTTVSIGNGVDSLGYEIPVVGWGTFVGGEIFSGCNNLSTLNLSNGIRYIGYRTFHNCEALTTIKIPSSVTKISFDAFDGCKGLTSVHIDDMAAWCNISFSNLSSNPLVYAHRLYLRENEVKRNLIIPRNSMTRINKYAFAGLIDFTSLTIPPNVETIDDDAFYGCTNLASVTIEDGDPTNTLQLSSNCYGSSPVGGIYVGRNISFDGNSPFYQNNTLKYVVIGDKVTSIPDKAFSGCNSLNYVSIGASMKTIGQEAFTSVTELPNLICWAVNPPTCGSNALTDINKWTCRLQVPKQSLNLYKSADQWKDFLLVEDLTGIKGVHETAIDNHFYDINGQFLLQPKRGVNIVKTSDGKTRKVVVK